MKFLFQARRQGKTERERLRGEAAANELIATGDAIAIMRNYENSKGSLRQTGFDEGYQRRILAWKGKP